jgi:hypothetical protein
MSRTSINFLLDSCLLITFATLGCVALIVRFVFPSGTESRGWYLWGMSYNQWATAQFAIVAILALGILIHVMLHWSWVCGVVATRLARNKKTKLDDGTQTLYGVGLLIVIFNILGLAIAAAALSIQGPH